MRFRLKKQYGAYDNQKALDRDQPNPYRMALEPHGKSGKAIRRWEASQAFFNKWKITTEDQTKKKTPFEIIDEFKSKFGKKKIICLYSGGKDSSATAHILHEANMLDHCLTVDTGVSIKELPEFMKKETSRQGWKLKTIKSLQSFDDWVYEYGHPSSAIHHVVMFKLKFAAFRKYLKDMQDQSAGFASGVRGEGESAKRGRSFSYHIDNDGKTFFCRPIFNMTNDEIVEYCLKEDLRISPAYPKIHISGDCLCGSHGTAVERYEFKQYYPEEYAVMLKREESARNSPYITARLNWEWGNNPMKFARVKMFKQLNPLFKNTNELTTEGFDTEDIPDDACAECQTQLGSFDEDIKKCVTSARQI